MSSFMLLRTQRPQFSAIRMRMKSSLPRSEKANDISQGHVTNPKNVHQQDVQSQSVRGGSKARNDETNESIDAAHQYRGAGQDKRPGDIGKGNPERIGFVEQVGGASSSARKFERKEEE